MNNLLVGVILGFLAAVHSTSVNTESDFLQEVMKDEFLIPTLPTQILKRDITIQAFQQSSLDLKITEIIESSPAGNESISHPSRTQNSQFDLRPGGGELPKKYPTTVSSPPSSPRKEATTTLLIFTAAPLTIGSDSGSGMDEVESESPIASKINTKLSFLTYPYSTQNSDLGSGNGQLLYQHGTAVSSRNFIPRNKAEPSFSTSTATVSMGSDVSDSGLGMYERQTESSIAAKTNIKLSFLNHLYSTQTSDLGSGNGQLPSQNPATVSSKKFIPGNEAEPSFSTSTAPPVSTEGDVSDSGSEIHEEISQSNPEYKPVGHESPQNTVDSTPGWIIILTGVVGVAALVIVCVAIVTKEKWYGPSQVSQLETKTSQQRELEMETFLHNDQPRENGNDAEYIVIPLDELPESYTSH